MDLGYTIHYTLLHAIEKNQELEQHIITSTWPQHCSHFLGQINTCFGNMQKIYCEMPPWNKKRTMIEQIEKYNVDLALGHFSCPS